MVWQGPDELRALLVPVESLVPWASNYRRGRVDMIAASLRAFGQMKPVVAKGGTVYVGNHTMLAAIEAGYTHLAAIDAIGLSDDEVMGYAVADNATADEAENDRDLLAPILQQLRERDALDTAWAPSDTDALLDALGAVTRAAATSAGATPDDDEDDPPPASDGTSEPRERREVVLVFPTAQEHDEMMAQVARLRETWGDVPLRLLVLRALRQAT